MEKNTIYCENNNELYECEQGESLMDLSKRVDHKCKFPVLAALVDNQLKELGLKLYMSHRVRFIDYSHSDGIRTYMRSLSFVLQRAVVDLYPQYKLILDYSLPNGLYGELRRKEKNSEGLSVDVNISIDEALNIKKKMLEIIKSDLPIIKEKVTLEKAVKLFRDNGQSEKVSLLEHTGKYFVSVYFIDGYADTFYGPQLYSTGAIDMFDLISYSNGFCLQAPSIYGDKIKLDDHKYQDKLSAVFEENSDWCSIIGANGVGTVNTAIRDGYTKDMIQVAEALHERKYACIADMIYSRRDKVKLVLIAGPSSSGKTTTSKRIALQCKVLGLNPVVIAMDNYFVNRDKTPRDENGEYNFEALNAVDLPFFNQQLNQMFLGEEVELPKFDFIKGERYFDGEKIRLTGKDILITEGIHALNPELTQHIDSTKIFKIFASALTSLSLDENNNISTSDNRLLRRMVRDFSNRGISPEDTILRWPSVRSGEKKNIFPYQENADVMFNSMLIYGLPVLKYYAEPLLQRIPLTSPASSEAFRLLKFLSYILPIIPKEMECIPPTSVLREFIGGSSFGY